MITAFAFSCREYFINFEKFLYESLIREGLIKIDPGTEIFSRGLCAGGKMYSDNIEELLGRNWSFFISSSPDDKSTKMVLFDADDCSGWLAEGFKLKKEGFDKIVSKFNVDEFIVFKAQYSESHIFNRFYPLQEWTYPLGYFCDNPEKIISAKSKIKKIPVEERDIDFLWIGSLHDKADQRIKSVWPDDLSFDYWTPGIRRRCFDAVNKIAEKRRDWNIVCSDKRLEKDEYFDLLSRTKVCLDFPGIGYHTRRFFENMILEKFCLVYKNEMKLPYPIYDGQHFEFFDTDLSKLEEKMEKTISNSEKIHTIEDNLRKDQRLFTYDFIVDNIKSVFLSHFGREI